MIVVSDATPLIFLGKLNAVELLKNLYQTVLISPKVYHEAIINGLKYGHPDAVVLNLYYQKNILKIDTPVDQMAITQLQTDEGIDPGEAETIVLAMQQSSEWASTRKYSPKSWMTNLLRMLYERLRIENSTYRKKLNSMVKPFRALRHKMSVEAQQQAKEKAAKQRT